MVALGRSLLFHVKNSAPRMRGNPLQIIGDMARLTGHRWSVGGDGDRHQQLDEVRRTLAGSVPFMFGRTIVKLIKPGITMFQTVQRHKI